MNNYLSITLKPYWKEDTIAYMDLECACPAQMFENAEGLVLDYPDQAFGGLCPFPDYQDFTLRDDAGDVPYHRDSAPTCYSAATFQGFYAERPLSGEVHWSYRILPRILPEGYRSSPYYDFRAEPLGLNGSGMFSFILPVTTERIAMQLDWNLREMPEGARGIWSYGEGKVHVELTTWQIRLSLFNVGKMQAVEHGDFGVYWFSEPYFDARSVAERLYPIFQYMKDYFGDHESSFRVFLRRDPFEFSGGGSACAYAFISGYSAFGGMEEDEWFNVLIHEMTHTWPSMQDFHVDEGTWFTEGATEFYCTMLPYRAGLLDADFTVKCINEKIPGRYLNNVYREMPNDKLPEIQWKDRRAQTVPYGRGFLYLANADFKMRTQGKGSIDDIVRRHNIMNQMTLREWKEFIQERLGDEGMQDFEDMCSGKLIEPLDGIFGDEIAMVKDEIELDGKPATTYHWEVRH